MGQRVGAGRALGGSERRQCPAVDTVHCVIPAAGMGTRFLPATAALPKELLPVLDKPVIQWGVEEAVAAGARSVVLVIAVGKELIGSHFELAPALERVLEERGRGELLESIRHLQRVARLSYVYQSAPLGLGHAVLAAERVVGDRPFLCLLPDDLSSASRPVLAQLADAYRECRGPVLALKRMPRERISRYGCAVVTEGRGRLHRVTEVVEKPAPGEVASDLAILGRYVLTPAVFSALHATPPGIGGEIQLTDGIAGLLEEGPVWGLEFDGELLDVGTPRGWLATNLRLARSDARFSAAVHDALEAAHP